MSFLCLRQRRGIKKNGAASQCVSPRCVRKMAKNEKEGGKCGNKVVFSNCSFKKNRTMAVLSHNKSEQRTSQGGIFNYSLLPTSQSEKGAQLWGVHKSVVISTGYPGDKSGHVRKLHAIAQASQQLNSFQEKFKKLNRICSTGWRFCCKSTPLRLVTHWNLTLNWRSLNLQVQSSSWWLEM